MLFFFRFTYQENKNVHHQRIIHASSLRHQCIISASSVQHQCIINASSAHCHHIISASSAHRQGIFGASSKSHFEFDMPIEIGLVDTQIPSINLIKLILSFAQLYVVILLSRFCWRRLLRHLLLPLLALLPL